MRIVKFSLLIIFILTTIACVQPIQRIPFPIDEYQKLNKTGTGIVKGQAFLKTRGGDVKFAAGNEVLLNPVTLYSRQWYETVYLSKNPFVKLTEPDTRNDEYILRTVADGDGRFEFTNVPAGKYYLVSYVFWEAPSGYQGGVISQGGWIAKQINVKDGDKLNIILTK